MFHKNQYHSQNHDLLMGISNISSIDNGCFDTNHNAISEKVRTVANHQRNYLISVLQACRDGQSAVGVNITNPAGIANYLNTLTKIFTQYGFYNDSAHSSQIGLNTEPIVQKDITTNVRVSMRMKALSAIYDPTHKLTLLSAVLISYGLIINFFNGARFCTRDLFRLWAALFLVHHRYITTWYLHF